MLPLLAAYGGYRLYNWFNRFDGQPGRTLNQDGSSRIQQTIQNIEARQTNQLIDQMNANAELSLHNNKMEHFQQQIAQSMQHNRTMMNNAKEIFQQAQEDSQSWMKSSTQKLSQTAAA
jgi:hypothetical protein